MVAHGRPGCHTHIGADAANVDAGAGAADSYTDPAGCHTAGRADGHPVANPYAHKRPHADAYRDACGNTNRPAALADAVCNPTTDAD